MREFSVNTGFSVASKSKTRWDLGSAYFRAGFPSFTFSKDEILEVLSCNISSDKLDRLIESLYKCIADHMIKSVALDIRNIPTPAEYRATFQDLVDSVSGLEAKLSALNGFPFDHMIDEHILSRAPEKLSCDVIEETINNLKVIRQAGHNALDDMDSAIGRRKKLYSHISLFVSIATVFEKYTDKSPTKYCNESGHGEYAKLVHLCCQKMNIPVTSDFCNQIKMAVEKYKNGR